MMPISGQVSLQYWSVYETADASEGLFGAARITVGFFINTLIVQSRVGIELAFTPMVFRFWAIEYHKLPESLSRRSVSHNSLVGSPGQMTLIYPTIKAIGYNFSSNNSRVESNHLILYITPF